MQAGQRVQQLSQPAAAILFRATSRSALETSGLQAATALLHNTAESQIIGVWVIGVWVEQSLFHCAAGQQMFISSCKLCC
jgi:hypothetical protein